MNDIPVVGMLDIWKDFLCMIIIIRNSEHTDSACASHASKMAAKHLKALYGTNKTK